MWGLRILWSCETRFAKAVFTVFTKVRQIEAWKEVNADFRLNDNKYRAQNHYAMDFTPVFLTIHGLRFFGLK